MLRRYQRSQCKKAAPQQQRKLHTQKQKNNDVYLFWHSTILWNRRFYAKNGGSFQHFGPSAVHMGSLRSESKTHFHWTVSCWFNMSFSWETPHLLLWLIPQKESMVDEAETYFYITSWPKSNVNSSLMYWEDNVTSYWKSELVVRFLRCTDHEFIKKMTSWINRVKF